MKLVIENFRCFSGERELSLRPITLLTGENSSGKSTVMAALNIIADKNRFPLAPDFNKEPFNLGNYNTIASYKGGRYGRAAHFKLGIVQEKGDSQRGMVVGTYMQQKGMPVVQSIQLENPLGKLSIDFKPDKPIVSMGIATGPEGQTEQLTVELDPGDRSIESLSSLQEMMFTLILRKIENRKDPSKLFTTLYQLLNESTSTIPVVRSIAPIRSKPSRTYDQAEDEYSPEGTHIPYVLAKLYTERASDKRAEAMLKIVEAYGKESGLFTSLCQNF